MTSLFVNKRCLRAVTPLVYVFIKCNYSTLRRRHLGGENQDVYDHGVFEPVTPDPVLTASPYKRQVLASVSTSHMERSIKSKISVLIDRQHWLKGQFNMQVIGDTGRTWKVSCLSPLESRGGDWAGPQPAQAPPRCTKCNRPPINGQCTNHRIAVVVRCSAVLMCP